MDEKSIFLKYCSDCCRQKFFQHLRISIFKINNNFAMKNDKISHFENLIHVSHLKGSGLRDTSISKGF